MFLGLKESAPKRHLDRFSRFCRAHERDQQTDTQTDKQTDSVCSNRPLSLANTAMWPKNIFVGTSIVDQLSSPDRAVDPISECMCVSGQLLFN